jgi:ribosome-binding protein aMBF1 (putative translation factor)
MNRKQKESYCKICNKKITGRGNKVFNDRENNTYCEKCFIQEK